MDLHFFHKFQGLGQAFPPCKSLEENFYNEIIMSENFLFDVSLVPDFCFQEINKNKLTKRERLRK